MSSRDPLIRAAFAGVLLVAGAAVATQVPLVPNPGPAGSVVPLDTWLAAHFPAARDLFRMHLARAFEPWRLPALALLLSIALGLLASWRTLGTWLVAHVPPISPVGLGAYRLVLGLALAGALAWVRPPEAVPPDVQRAASWLASTSVIRRLASTPDAAWWMHTGAVAAFLWFASGVLARQALLVAAILLSLFVGVMLTVQGAHDWGVPLLTVWVLTLVPWGSSVSIASVFRHGGSSALDTVSDEQRGFAIWIPGLTVGLAFAAAAFAKLDTSGLTWITGGAVRYHFIEDAGQAPSTLGLMLTRSDVLAAATAFGAVAIESGFWAVTLCRRSVARAAFGIGAVTLLAGFYLCQGVFWPAWWALLLAFLPWSEVDAWLVGVLSRRPPPAPPSNRGLSISARTFGVAPRLAVTLLVIVQVGASLLRVENEPFFSDFAMYAYTWPSKDAFAEHLASKTRRLVFSVPDLESGALDGRLRELPRAHDVVAGAVDLALRGQPWPDDVRVAVSAVQAEYVARYRQTLRAVDVSSVEQAFDWDRNAFAAAPRAVSHGTVDLELGVRAHSAKTSSGS